ncbi:hypothetical protein OG21DRAFT_1490345 [Imleria badia]|nr:hypothetical protein OG21DRAFT_1490345 [Imleria badia]
MIPLFGVLQTEVEDTEWAEESAHRVGELFRALSDAALTAAGHDTQLEAGIILHWPLATLPVWPWPSCI